MEMKPESIELCLAELEEVCENIQQLQNKYKTLIQQRNYLRQRAKEMMSTTPTGYSSRRVERDQKLVKFVADLLRQQRRPLSLQEICQVLQQVEADFIPFQIISLKTYVNRRLMAACDDGYLRLLPQEEYNGKFYALPV